MKKTVSIFLLFILMFQMVACGIEKEPIRERKIPKTITGLQFRGLVMILL